MAKGEQCRVTNCKNIITYKGRVCGTHKWRIGKYGTYDLPNHQGEPNFFVEKKLPDGIVGECDKHGFLALEDTYPRKYKSTIHYQCKKCTLSLNIKKKYSGMTCIEDYEKLLHSQGDVCACCGGLNTTKRNGKIKRFAIDHCHKTQKVRGLLCAFCNALIGYARDDIKILQSAILYLKSHE